MPLFDRIVAWIALGGTGGLIALRSAKAWLDFRRQRKALDLLVRSMTELERPAKERHG